MLNVLLKYEVFFIWSVVKIIIDYFFTLIFLLKTNLLKYHDIKINCYRVHKSEKERKLKYHLWNISTI